MSNNFNGPALSNFPITQGVTTTGSLLTYISNVPQVSLVDSGILDAFGRIRIGLPETIFDSKQIYDSQPLVWDDQQTSGAGTSSTFIVSQSCTQIAVASLTAGTRMRQTFRRFNYEPGKSHSITFTAVFGTGSAGVIKRAGYYDTNNGPYFMLSGTSMYTGLRTATSLSPVDTVVSQSSWNIDPLNGTGASGITLDMSKGQIFAIDFQWLGVGRVRYGFVINGKLYYCHQIQNANVLDKVYMSTPNLPIRYEIKNDGTGPVQSLNHICSSVISEGGRTDTGIVLSVDRGATSISSGNDTLIYALLTIRLKNFCLSATIKPLVLSIISTTANASYKSMLLLNPTLSGSALSYSNVTNSCLQYAVTDNTNTISAAAMGTQIYSEYQASNKSGGFLANLPTDVIIGSNIAGTSDVLVLAVQPVPVQGATVFFGGLVFREEI